VRFTRWRRRRFFALLEESGNVRMAAELAGVGIKAVYRLRMKEPGFAARMEEAKEKAGARLDRSEVGPSTALHAVPLPRKSGGGIEDGLVVRRGAGGRLRLVAAGPHRWEKRHDEIFLVHFRGTGNVTAAARAAGFTAKAAHDRRKANPGFAVAWERALPEAEMRLNGRLLEEAMRWSGETYEDTLAAEPPPPPDAWLALAALRYWDRKKAGRTRRPTPREGE